MQVEFVFSRWNSKQHGDAVVFQAKNIQNNGHLEVHLFTLTTETVQEMKAAIDGYLSEDNGETFSIRLGTL